MATGGVDFFSVFFFFSSARRGRGFLFLSFSRVFSGFPSVFPSFSPRFLVVLNYKKTRENYEKTMRKRKKTTGKL